MFPISDGVKKWSILIPTWPLPATWRVAVRRRYLARLELAKAERANLIIIGHLQHSFLCISVHIGLVYGCIKGS